MPVWNDKQVEYDAAERGLAEADRRIRNLNDELSDAVSARKDAVKRLREAGRALGKD